MEAALSLLIVMIYMSTSNWYNGLIRGIVNALSRNNLGFFFCNSTFKHVISDVSAITWIS